MVPTHLAVTRYRFLHPPFILSLVKCLLGFAIEYVAGLGPNSNAVRSFRTISDYAPFVLQDSGDMFYSLVHY